MSENKKPLFPVLKKKIKWFLTDESGKISKKDALGLSAWAVLLSSAEDVLAWSHSNSCTTANRAWPDYTYAATSEQPWMNAPCWIRGSIVANHASWVVNWHYSGVPDLSWTATLGHSSHGSHGSHGSRW